MDQFCDLQMVGQSNQPGEGPLLTANTRFGTDGIRGPVDTVLTPALAMKIGYWYGKGSANTGPFIIGRDSRISGPMLCSALSAGLNAAGKEVWDIGICPTPAIPFLIKRLSAAGGVMVSASHNPPSDNGIKLFDSLGEKIKKERQKNIEKGLNGEESGTNFQSSSNKSFVSTYQKEELLTLYSENLLIDLQPNTLNGVPIVLDLCWGSATACCVDVFEALGANLTVINSKPNGYKINVKCGSTDLTPLQKAVLETKGSMGFAFDGDADRVLAVDGQGRVLDGDHLLYLWGSSLQDKKKLPRQLLISTIMSNLGFEKAWIKRGGVLERTPVGDQYVHDLMISKGATLGGEQSGHILSSLNGLCGDGIFTALQIANICNESGESLCEWMERSFIPYPQKLVNINISNEVNRKSWKDCQELQEAVNNAEESMGSEGRVLLRASGTEPLLRVMVEASDPKAVDNWTSQLTQLAKKHLKAA